MQNQAVKPFEALPLVANGCIANPLKIPETTKCIKYYQKEPNQAFRPAKVFWLETAAPRCQKPGYRGQLTIEVSSNIGFPFQFLNFIINGVITLLKNDLSWCTHLVSISLESSVVDNLRSLSYEWDSTHMSHTHAGELCDHAKPSYEKPSLCKICVILHS